MAEKELDKAARTVRDELTEVAAARQLSAFNALDLPALTRAASRVVEVQETDASNAAFGANTAVQSLIDIAIDAMPTPSSSRAALTLVGSTERRWANAKERRHLSGKEIGDLRGVTGETFRKNHERPVLDELAATIEHLAGQGDSAARVSRLVWAAAIMAIGVILATLLLWLTYRGDNQTSDSTAATTVVELPTTTTVVDETTQTTTSTTSPPPVTATFRPSGDVDVSLYCMDVLGEGAVAEVIGNSADSWICRIGDESQPVDFDEACASSYGPVMYAINIDDGPYDWACTAEQRSFAAGECPIVPGEHDPESQYDLGRYAQGFASAADTDVRLADLCPTAVMHRAGEGVRQTFFDPDSGSTSEVAALLVRLPEEAPILLTGNAWDAFDQVAGLGAGLVGYPLSEPAVLDDGSWHVPFSVGGGLVGLSDGGPFHWMPAVAYERWKTIGGLGSCLGLPVSNPYPVADGFQQDFAQGRLVLNFTSGALDELGESC